MAIIIIIINHLWAQSPPFNTQKVVSSVPSWIQREGKHEGPIFSFFLLSRILPIFSSTAGCSINWQNHLKGKLAGSIKVNTAIHSIKLPSIHTRICTQERVQWGPLFVIPKDKKKSKHPSIGDLLYKLYLPKLLGWIIWNWYWQFYDSTFYYYTGIKRDEVSYMLWCGTFFKTYRCRTVHILCNNCVPVCGVHAHVCARRTLKKLLTPVVASMEGAWEPDAGWKNHLLYSLLYC